MRYNFYPTLTKDFLSKLILLEPEQTLKCKEVSNAYEKEVIKFEELAFTIYKKIKGVLTVMNIQKMKK